MVAKPLPGYGRFMHGIAEATLHLDMQCFGNIASLNATCSLRADERSQPESAHNERAAD